MIANPDRADEIHEALAGLRPELRPAMAALYDLPATWPVLTAFENGQPIAGVCASHLAEALLSGRTTPADVLDVLDRRGALRPADEGAQ